jgi:hypothetical protein
MITASVPLDASAYQRHALHGDDKDWVEKNCYIDIWIEVLHAHGLDPMAVLPFTLAVDFEHDQWTFFKPPHVDLWQLYGVDVQELTVWRPLIDHAVTHLAAGKLISTEADAFFLPDTQGTDYKTQHTKTTIVLHKIDVGARRLGYFHNAAYHELGGDDSVGLFRLGLPPDPTFLPLFAECIRVDRAQVLDGATLRVRSRDLLRRALGLRPSANPVAAFAARFGADIAQLQTEGLARYHVWAFATIRQLGAAFELAALYLRWLEADPTGSPGPLAPAAEAFASISAAAKTLILKAARAVNARRAVDFQPLLAPAVEAWQRGMDLLATALVLDNPKPRP